MSGARDSHSPRRAHVTPQAQRAAAREARPGSRAQRFVIYSRARVGDPRHAFDAFYLSANPSEKT